MITAIVMIKCKVGQVHSVAEALVALDGIAEVYSISGEFDILTLVRVREYEMLSTVVSQNIAGLEGIAKTNTQMAFRCYSKHDMEKMWAQFMAE